MATPQPIYMDNHATTRLDPRVLEVMLPYLTEQYGNAASRSHVYGWTAEAAVDRAREQVAELIGTSPSELVFTSGATEADNMAIKGAARANRQRGNHIVTVATEHKAVLDSCKRLESEGFEVTYLVPDTDGLVTPAQVAAAVGEQTLLVSVMLVNNEIGVIQPVEAIGRAVKAVNDKVLLHCDAVQAAGKLDIDLHDTSIDMFALSAHKTYGPKGIGALWIRRRPRVRIEPLIDGGGHERGLRAGTLPVAAVVGFGEAAALAQANLVQSEAEPESEPMRVAVLRDALRDGIMSGLTGVHENGSREARVCGNLNLSFDGVEGEALLMALREVAVSSGAACSSASREPSYVLRALGVASARAHSSIRFGLGRFNTAGEVARVIDMVCSAVADLRALRADSEAVVANSAEEIIRG